MTTAESALFLWGLEGATVTLVAARENAVYRVDLGSKRYALRLHRKGYRTDSELTAELDWMAMLGRTGLSVPTPIASLSGLHLHIVDGVQVDVLTWLEGDTLADALPALDRAQRLQLFRNLGRIMAQMHDASDAWSASKTCDRPAWSSEGLLGDAPLWDQFWDNPALTLAQKSQMLDFRARAAQELDALKPSLDYGLIHADLVPANVMVADGDLHLIDFDDGGYGFRLFEIATALLKLRAEPDFPAIKDAMLNSYAQVRPIITDHLPLFMALRAATYVGWNITRSKEDRAGNRNARFIKDAEDLIATYMM